MLNVLSLIMIAFLALSCGKKSQINTHIEAEQLGDGEHITQPVILPLSDKVISSYESNTENMTPLFRAFVNTIINIGTTIGAGKTRLSLIQPIPEIPEEYVSSLKIKRIFFYIETSKGNEDFSFLRKIAVKMSSLNMEAERNSWDPIIEAESLDSKESSFFRRLFRQQRDRLAEEWDKDSKGLVLIRYNQEEKSESLRKDAARTMLILETKKPLDTRKYLDQNLRKHYNKLHVLNKSILIELKNDPVMIEIFKSRLARDTEKLVALEIGDIKPCSDNVCLDLKIPDANLMPLLRQGNAIKIDTYIDPKKTPKSFQLKGFVEFEVKVPAKI